MSTAGRVERQEINLNADTEVVWFEVMDDVTVSIQAEQHSATWGTAVLNIVMSNSGSSPVQYDALTLGPGNDMEKDIGVDNIRWIGVQVVTVEAADEKATITMCAKQDS